MTIKNAKIISWVLLILLCSFRITHLVYAVDTVLEVGIPGVPGAEPGAPVSGIVQYISFLYTFVLGFVGIAGFASIVFWGAVWTGSGVVDQKSRALEGIKNALYGIGIAFGAFIILNTINPDLTVIKLPAIPGVDISGRIPSYAEMKKDVIVEYIKAVFGPDAAMAEAVANCESKYVSNAIRLGKSGKPADIGVFQINLDAHGKKVGETQEEQIAYLIDYKKNIDYAYQLFSQTHNWDAWYMTQHCHSPNNTAMAQKKANYCNQNPITCDKKDQSLQSAPPPKTTTATNNCNYKCKAFKFGEEVSDVIKNWF